MNSVVHLTKRVRTPNGFRYCPVVIAANGRLKPDWVLVNGKPERHPEGSYYIEHWSGQKRIRKAVGKNAADAATAQAKKAAALSASNHGVEVVPDNKDKRRPLAAAVEEYIEDVKLNHKPKTIAAYRMATRYFLECCSKTYVEDVERRDLLVFSAWLRDTKTLSARSVHNTFANVLSFLKSCGVRGLMKKEDWPKYTEAEPEIYEHAELEQFFKVCDSEERLWFEFFLMTGMREQEVMYTYWRDVNLSASTVRVTHKPDRGWIPKTYREREIPVPSKLFRSLKAWKSKADKTCPLVFPTSGCNPKLDFLDSLKVVAKRAKLNPDDFWLHRFRSTFATWHLWNGTDLRTVQAWLGHTDLESTLRYLKPNRGADVQAKVNAAFGG